MYFFSQIWRRRLRRTAALWLVCAAFAGAALPCSAAEELSLYATAAVLMDADTGRVLYEKNGDAFLANASTTKIMTCILALENGCTDEMTEISAYAASMPKVKLYMKAGEHFRLGDLLYSLMLESHNDSAVAIAENIGGSMEGFAGMMNEKAAAIGCTGTCFITPNGLDATRKGTDKDGNPVQLAHGTTARDLARIMAYCCFYSPKKEEFLDITRAQSYSFTNEEGRSFSCNNHNTFLNMMEGALSGKTGFTNKAGYCYVGALEREGKKFTIALLGCGWPNHKTWKWADSKELFGYGLRRYTYHGLAEAEYDPLLLKPVPVEDGQTEKLGQSAYVELRIDEKGGTGYAGMAYLAGEASIQTFQGLLLDEEERIEVTCTVEKHLTAPVEAGVLVGSIRYMVGEECIRELPVVTAGEVPRIDLGWCVIQVLKKYVL